MRSGADPVGREISGQAPCSGPLTGPLSGDIIPLSHYEMIVSQRECSLTSRARGGIPEMTTTMQPQPKHVLPGQGSAYRARGFLCTFKLLASDTNGAFTLSEASNAPGTGVPPH